MTRGPTRLDSFTLLQAAVTLEASLHTALAEAVHVRRTLEAWPTRGAHPLDLVAISSALSHAAKATTQIRQLPLGRP
jgi:hypothetical protein